MKHMWNHIAIANGIDFSTDGFFKDNTLPLKTFNAAINSGEAGQLINALNRTAFPSTRCSQGCFMYIEQHKLVPLHHLMNYELSQFDFCNANAGNFRGKRPLWPREDIRFKGFRVRPGLIADPDMGLCIMACTDHSDASHEYVSIPEHPSLKSGEAWQGSEPDVNAPVHLTAHLMNTGNSKKNARFATVKQNTNVRGSSTTSIAPSNKVRRNSKKTSIATHMANVLPVLFRKDINRYTKKNKKIDPGYHHQTCYEGQGRLDYEKQKNIFDKFIPTGSFVNRRDALEAAHEYNESQKRGNKKNLTRPIHTLNINEGKKANQTLIPQKSDDPRDAVITIAYFCLQQSSVLRADAWKFAHSDPVNHDLIDLIKSTSIVTRKKQIYILKKFRAMYNNVMTHEDKGKPTQQQICIFLSHILPFINTHDTSEVTFNEALSEGDYNLLFMSNEEENDLGFPFDEESQGHSKMIQTKMHIQRAHTYIRFDFRMENNLKWQTIAYINGKSTRRKRTVRVVTSSSLCEQ